MKSPFTRTALSIAIFSAGLSFSTASEAAKFCHQLFENKKSQNNFFYDDNVDGIRQFSKNDKIIAAKSLLLTIENYYGPLKLKEKSIKLKWEKHKQDFLKNLDSIQTEQDFLFQFSHFLNLLNDAHVSVQLPSSLKWELPIQLSYSYDSKTKEDKYILNFMDMGQIKNQIRSGELPPLNAELISINSLPVQEFQKKYSYFNKFGNDLTNKSMFGSQLFNLSEQSGVPLSAMQNKVFEFKFKWTDATGQTIQKQISLEYISSGQGIITASTVLPKNNPSFADVIAKFSKQPINNQPNKTALTQVSKSEKLFSEIEQMISGKSPLANEVQRAPVEKKRKLDPKNGLKVQIGQRLPVFKLPENFVEMPLPKVFENSFNPNHLFAGTFVKNGQRVGLLRIPTYTVENIETSFEVINYYVKTLEISTDYLIIDQMYNPGGYVVYSDYWVQALAGKIDSKKHMQFQVRPTQKFLQQYASILKLIDTNSLMVPNDIRDKYLSEIRQQFEIIHRAYQLNEPLSQPISFLPFFYLANFKNEISPQTTSAIKDLFDDQPEFAIPKTNTYTKPIFMLINEFDFSAGDATPAQLQDYKRATIIGNRTAGAGGSIESFESKILDTHFNFNLTSSLMYRQQRPEQPYVENYGVQPDIQLAPSVEDYTNGFSNYFDKVLQITESAMKQKASKSE